MSDLNPLHPAEAAESSIFWFYDNLIYKIKVTVQSNLQNATHFVGVAYPPNKISKTVLKMQAFYTCFFEILLGSEQLQNINEKL